MGTNEIYENRTPLCILKKLIRQELHLSINQQKGTGLNRTIHNKSAAGLLNILPER